METQTQNLWKSPIWWLGMILLMVQVAISSMIEQGLGDPSILTTINNVIAIPLMFAVSNNPGLKNLFTPAGGETLQLKE